LNRLEIFQVNERWATIISHILISLMMVCLAISLTQFFRRFISMSGALPVWGCVITGEAFLSYRITRLRAPSTSAWLLSRVAEWVVLLSFTKLIIDLQGGVSVLLQDMHRWEESFGQAFFSSEYLATIFVLFTIWVLSTLYTADLAELEGSDFIRKTLCKKQEQMGPSRPTQVYDIWGEAEMLPSNRREIHKRLLFRTLTVGVAMVIIAGLLRQEQFTIWQRQPLARVSIFNILLYFFLGLGLLSQTNFLALRASWGYEHVSLTRHLASRWATYSFIFLFVLGAIALILPTRYSLGFLDTLRYVLSFTQMIVEFIIGVILLPFVLIFQLFSMLFGGGTGKLEPGPTQPIIPTATPETGISTQTQLPWWEVFKSFVFWGAFLAILGFALYQYIQQNQALLATLKNLRVVQWMNQAWRWLGCQFRTARRNVKTVVRLGLVKLRAFRIASQTPAGWRFLNPHRLTPRQRVIFFYLALIRRGNEAGYPRQPSQTPYEYAHFIEPGLPEQADALSDMTEAFLEARYSRHEVTTEQVSRMKRAWDRVRSVLKYTHNRLVTGNFEEARKRP
jgi:hypothetical protein